MFSSYPFLLLSKNFPLKKIDELFIFLPSSRCFVKIIVSGDRTLQPFEKVVIRHAEPGPEHVSGSNDFRISDMLISPGAEMNSA
jgi:hypothetical protein